jgi:hypothetical protein
MDLTSTSTAPRSSKAATDPAGPTGQLATWPAATTSAAVLNSSFIQGFELDDYHPLAPLHSNALVLPAMLTPIARPALG